MVSKQRKEARKKKKEEEKLARVEPNRWGPWIEYFDKDTKHPYYFNMETKETVWKLSDSTKRKYETRESKSRLATFLNYLNEQNKVTILNATAKTPSPTSTTAKTAT